MSTTYPTPAQSAPKSTTTPYMSWITQADPDFQAEKHRQVEYETSRRVFTADPYRRGAYDGTYLLSDDGRILLADDGATILTST